MIWALYIAGGLIGTLIVLGVVLAILGSRLPEDHAASMTIRLRRPVEDVWAAIDDVMAYPAWAKGVTRVEKLPDRDGREAVRQTMGRNSFVLERVRYEPPRVLERWITDDRGPFSGSWTYELAPAADGCTVKLTERGRVQSALPRAVMKHLVGYHTYLAGHLASLAGKFGEEVVVVEKRMGG